MCDYKQSYTQYGGLRPFGVSFLFAGWDQHYGFQLYQSDPSGNYAGWQATAIGSNFQGAQSILKSDYKEGEMSLDVKHDTRTQCNVEVLIVFALQDALLLAVKVLNKTMDTTTPSPEKCRFTFCVCVCV